MARYPEFDAASSASVAPPIVARALTAVEARARVEVGAASSGELVGATRRVALVRGWLDALEAEIASRAKELSTQGSGAPPVDLLTREGRLSGRDAQRVERRAVVVEQAPQLGVALRSGEIGAAHVDAVASAAGRLDESLRASFFEHEPEIVRTAASSSPEELARYCGRLADRVAADEGVARAERQRQLTSLRRSIDQTTGMYRLHAELHPELGHRLWMALDAEVDARAAAAVTSGDRDGAVEMSRDRVAAEALVDLVSGGHQMRRPARTEVLVVVDHATLQHGLHEAGVCELGDGTAIPPAAARRLACDAAIIPVVLGGDGRPLDVGREQRLATADQRRALRVVYRTCAVDGCSTPFHRCEIHHSLEWLRHAGPTDLRHLLPLCSRHHHLVHEGGWRIQLDADRTLTVWHADGTMHSRSDPRRSTTHQRPEHPPAAEGPADAPAIQT
jgi:hypothetical protein